MNQFRERRPTGMWKAILHGVLALSVFLVTAICEASTPVRVTFINPSGLGNPFWDQVTSFMQTVARGLDMHLEVRYANNNRYAATDLAIEALRLNPKPDCLIYIYQTGQGLDILNAAEAAKVYSFIINTDVNASDRQLVGRPREKFKYWIGHLIPDDVSAGRDLANQLIEAAKAKGKFGPDGRIHAIALNGGRDSSAALDRSEGLRQVLQAHPEVVLHQAVFTNWDRQLARYQALNLLKRFPETELVWAASDVMAIGAIDGIEGNNKKAGVDVVTGGVDWTSDGIRAVKDGKMIATLGGHFMDGGWALVLVHDYCRGIDFAPSGTTIRSKMQMIKQDTIQSYSSVLDQKQWDSFDFRQFSKAYNPRLKEYDFSLRAVLNAKR